MKTGVRVEMGGVMKSIEEMQDLITAKDRDIMRYGRSIMKSETKRAFSSGSDPDTGRPWAPRKGSYSWAILRHTGTLLAALNWGYGIKTRDRKLKLFGKVRDAFYLGNYNRGNGPKPAIVVAASVHYGRSKARSITGAKRWGVAPSTGTVPARPFFGFSNSSRKRIKRYAEKRLKRTFD